MLTAHPPPLQLMDVVGPLLGAGVFIAIMSALKEPLRRTLNALLVAGASGVYLSGGFGVAELIFPALLMPIAYRALSSYRLIGVGWLLHAAWDVAHHVWGQPIWPFMPTSSFGCLIFDTAIAIWFWAGAPSLWPGRAVLGTR